MKGDTLWITLGGLTGLVGAAARPPDYEHRFILDPEPNQGFDVLWNCTEYDNDLPDGRMNDYGSYVTHTYNGGTDWNNGVKIVPVGSTAYGCEIEYSVSVRVL